ncbi:MAG: sulfur oxidation c-type cytochrome SoxA [Gammaproteobacteria bacterium]|nr:sulfur oxidation c-type cytochrome SoxA [Gammaproteobacteria bacterium]
MMLVIARHSARILCLMMWLPLTLAQADEPVSGYQFLSPMTQEMQDDEFANPGMAAVEDGRKLFHTVGDSGKSCASCHGEEGEKIDPKNIARYPVYNKDELRPFTLQDQINLCWEDNLDNAPFVYDCKEVVALETYVRFLARGEVVNVDISGPMKPHYESGQELYHTRFGQIDMACVHCHVYHQGSRMRGQVLTQGQSNGFPEYRLGTGKITSLHKRLSECFVSFRAQPFDRGSDEFIDLEVYVNAKGNGLKIETPAVRY